MLLLIPFVLLPILIWQTYRKMKLSKISSQWPTVTGVITAAERSKRGWRTQPQVSYKYEVGGKAYSSTKVTFADYVPAREIEPILSRYPVGQKVEIAYQPNDPAMAVLEPGPNRSINATLRAYFIWFAFVILLIFLDLGLTIYDVLQSANEATVPTYASAASLAPATKETQLQLGNRLIREAADQGDAQDQFYVAMWYRTGTEGYPKDNAQALAWLHKSADQGNAQAEDMLGNCYGRGEGVPKDLNQAVEWLQKAAAQGEPHACFSLGVMTEKGLGGLPQDIDQAKQWYQKAGDLPQAKDALKRLGGE